MLRYYSDIWLDNIIDDTILEFSILRGYDIGLSMHIPMKYHVSWNIRKGIVKDFRVSSDLKSVISHAIHFDLYRVEDNVWGYDDNS